MNTLSSYFKPQLLGAALAAAALISPALVSAQEVPSYADDGQSQQIQGTVSSINGTWNISVADANGYTDSVQLEQGTIINPTGLTLEPGMNVTIDGYADGSNFDALEIDTPYQYSGAAPTAVYYGDGAWYPGYAYGWGPSFSLFFDIGAHRFEQRSFAFDGRARRAIAPPSGWQDRPHGYIGHAAGVNRAPQDGRPQQQSRYMESTQRTQPQQRTFTQAPQQRTFNQPQQQRTFAQAPQPQQRTFAQAQQPQQRTFAQAPQMQQRSFAPQQQARSFSAPAQRAAAPAARGNGGGDRRR